MLNGVIYINSVSSLAFILLVQNFCTANPEDIFSLKQILNHRSNTITSYFVDTEKHTKMICMSVSFKHRNANRISHFRLPLVKLVARCLILYADNILIRLSFRSFHPFGLMFLCSFDMFPLLDGDSLFNFLMLGEK